MQSSILPEGGVYTPGDYQKDVWVSLLPVKTLPKALRTGMQISSKEQKFIKFHMQILKYCVHQVERYEKELSRMTLRAPQDTSGKDVSANASIMLTVQAHYYVKCRPFKTNRRCDLDSCC